jgi:biopolymer transport protein ExbB
MGKQRAVVLGVMLGVVLVASMGALGQEAQKAQKGESSLGGMLYTATFTNVIGFLDIVPELSVAQIKTMFDERRFREALEFCQADPAFVSGVVHAGLIEAANGYEAMERAMGDAAEERTARLYRKIEWLNLLGNVAPMLGLFGTVYGMMVAFSQIAAKGGKANPEDLAGGIMIALVSTFCGLLVAMPALSAYSIFRTRIEQMSMEAALVAEELLANFKPTAAA